MILNSQIMTEIDHDYYGMYSHTDKFESGKDPKISGNSSQISYSENITCYGGNVDWSARDPDMAKVIDICQYHTIN